MPRNIIILGLVSLVTDISSEMIYPLIPLYLTAVLGASPAILGLVEGVAESLASLLRIFSGQISDRFQRRKAPAIVGYGLSALGKILFVIASSWVGIFWARVADRFGKGIRTAPRDALIADSIGDGDRGKAFGLHRAMDTAGALIGILLAYLLFVHYHSDYILIFWLSAIPAVIGVGLLFTIREPGIHQAAAKRPMLAWSSLDQRLKAFIIITFLFNLGNSSNQFLLLRAGTSGFSAGEVILLYALMNVTYLFVSYPAARLSDKIGRRTILVSGYVLYGLVYLGFGLASAPNQFILLFAIYGLYIGFTEGVEKALLADIAPVELRATVYGLHAMAVGFALLPASALAGVLWDTVTPAAPFFFGGITGLLAAAAFWIYLKPPTKAIEN